MTRDGEMFRGSFIPESSVVNKLKRMGTSRRVRDGYTMHDLEMCLGEDGHKIQRWIASGWLRDNLQGTRRHDGNGRDIHRVREKDILTWIWAPKAFPLAFAPAGLKTVKLGGLTLVRSFSSALNDVEACVFMDTKTTLLQGISPILSLTLRASSPKRLIPVAVNPVMLGVVFTAASQRIP